MLDFRVFGFDVEGHAEAVEGLGLVAGASVEAGEAHLGLDGASAVELGGGQEGGLGGVEVARTEEEDAEADPVGDGSGGLGAVAEFAGEGGDVPGFEHGGGEEFDDFLVVGALGVGDLEVLAGFEGAVQLQEGAGELHMGIPAGGASINDFGVFLGGKLVLGAIHGAVARGLDHVQGAWARAGGEGEGEEGDGEEGGDAWCVHGGAPLAVAMFRLGKECIGLGRNMGPYAGAMGECVILRHTLEDGSWHWDWMFARGGTGDADEDARVLVTFRVDGRPDDAGCAAFEALRLADHRVWYLGFEGEIGRSLGRVERVARGEVVIEEEGPEAMVVRTRFGGCERRWRGERVEGARWAFREWVCAGSGR